MNEDLPKGWASVELEDHVYIAGRIGWRGLKRSEYTKTGPLFLAVKNILPSGELDFRETDYISRERYDESPEIKLQTGDILLTKDGSIGKVGMISSLPGATTVNSSILVVRPKNGLLNSRYLFHFLRGPQFQSIAHERITGSAVPHLFQKDIKKLRALVPPLGEQLRIVEKLEKVLGKVDACQQRLAKIPVILKRFRQSVLAAACSGRLTADWRDKNPNVEPAPQLLKRVLGQVKQKDVDPSAPDLKLPNTWSFVLSKYLFSFVTSGSRGWARYYSDEGPLFLRIGNLDHGTIYLDLRSVQSVRPPIGIEGTRTRVQANDILVSITADVGMIALVPENIEEAYINQHISLVRPIKGISSKFIAWYLASKEGGLKQFQELQRGMTKVGLGLDDIKSIWVPFPPLEEQHEIVRRVEAFFIFADQIETGFVKAKARVDQLTQSILAKAFRGELVPQNPNDEPASVLLERIKAERTGKDSGTQRRK